MPRKPKPYYVTGIKCCGYEVVRRADGVTVASRSTYAHAAALARGLNADAAAPIEPHPAHRYTLTLPLADNNGDSLAILYVGLERRLAREFGGYTINYATGAWSDPAAAHPGREAVRVYTIDTVRADAGELLRKIASVLALVAAQDAVYVTRQPIEVWLVTGADEAPTG